MSSSCDQGCRLPLPLRGKTVIVPWPRNFGNVPQREKIFASETFNFQRGLFRVQANWLIKHEFLPRVAAGAIKPRRLGGLGEMR